MSALDDWSIESFLPVADGRKAVILYTPDLESDLLSSIAIDRYGLNNVVWVYFEDFALNTNVSHEKFKYNFTDCITVNFAGIHRIYIPKNKLRDNFGLYNFQENILRQIALYKPDLITSNNYYFFIGMSKPELLMHRIASESFQYYAGDVMQYLDGKPEYLSIIKEYMETCSLNFSEKNFGDYFFGTRNLDIIHAVLISSLKLVDSGDINLPFSSLTYDEIAQLAINLGKESILLDSWNCYHTLHKIQKRCGVCSKCLQFKHALSSVNKLEGIEFAE